MSHQYYHRYSSKNISDALSDTPVVFIAGPRQSGKTTLVKSLIDSHWKYITLDDQAQLAIVKADPIGFIKNLSVQPVVIDEVQRLPELLLAIKQSVDENRTPGRFLLTGSSNALVLPRVLDSLAGRIEMIPLHTLSECEIKKIKPSFLSKLLVGKAPTSHDARIRNYLIKRIVAGCFPEPIQRSTESRIKAWYKQYVHSLIQKDVKSIEQIDHPEKMLKLLRLTAFYSGKLINYSEWGGDIGLDKVTIKKYTGLLEQLFLLKLLPAWHTNEYKRLVKTPKLHLTDTGLICAIRNINQAYLLEQPKEIGILLESFVYNELQKQAAWIHQDLSFYHYRNKDKVEVDCIIENASGDCFAIEIKASATLHPKDFTGLNHFRNVAGKRFKLGILLYDGDHTTAFGSNLFAVPLGSLWS
jgi:hypothetical protein